MNNTKTGRQPKIDRLVELALKYPKKSAKQLKQAFEKKEKVTVSMPVVYEAKKRAALQFEEYNKEVQEILDQKEFDRAVKEMKADGVNVVEAPGNPETQSPSGSISVGIIGLGEPSWTSFDIPAEDMEKTSKALEELQNRIENKTNCVDLMAVLALTQTYGKSIVLDLVGLVESLGAEKVRGVVNLIEEKDGKTE